ncbi:MAG: hypothetical protein V9G12_11370 [Microthrixaceae bacterium]
MLDGETDRGDADQERSGPGHLDDADDPTTFVERHVVADPHVLGQVDRDLGGSADHHHHDEQGEP